MTTQQTDRCLPVTCRHLLCCAVLFCATVTICRDVGVFVAITSLEPLLAYVHTCGTLLRFCSSEYVRDIKPTTPSGSYIIYGLDDYTHPTQGVFGVGVEGVGVVVSVWGG